MKRETVKHLAMESMECGCFCTGQRIEWCEIHGHASTLYEALELTRDPLWDMGAEDLQSRYYPILERVNAALALARGDKPIYSEQCSTQDCTRRTLTEWIDPEGRGHSQYYCDHCAELLLMKEVVRE